MTDDAQDLTPKRPPRWERAFLAALRDLGNVRAACEAAKIDRRTVYDRRDVNEEFRAAWASALDESADLLEAEARRRAYEGLRRCKFHNGVPIMVPAIGVDGLVIKDKDGNPEMIPYVEHEYSDLLLIFLLKGARPEKYRERTDVRHSGKIDVTRLSDDELRAIAES